jgi:hypothetical protein
MAGFHSITNRNDLHHHLILKNRLRITRSAIINLNKFPLESNQLTHHQIFPAAVVLHTALSIDRVMQPYHFTIMLVISHVAFKVTYPKSSNY